MWCAARPSRSDVAVARTNDVDLIGAVPNVTARLLTRQAQQRDRLVKSIQNR